MYNITSHAPVLLRRYIGYLQGDNTQFKVAALVFQSLTNQAPPVYLADDCHLMPEKYCRYPHSSTVQSQTRVVPRTYNHFGDRSFSAAGLWNSLRTVCISSELQTEVRNSFV